MILNFECFLIWTKAEIHFAVAVCDAYADWLYFIAGQQNLLGHIGSNPIFAALQTKALF